MARRGASTARAELDGLLRLAENPDFDDMDDGDEDDEEYLEDLDDDGVAKGKEVHGPRTKLSASIDRLSKGMAMLQRNEAILAQGLLAVLAKADEDEDDEKDDEDEKDEDSKEDKARLRKSARTAARSRVAKDDAASSFGEKDDDTPGNRPFDPTDTEEKDTMIQEGPGAGPGPVNKGTVTLTNEQLQGMLDQAVAKAQANTTVLKSTAPNPAGAVGSTAAAAMGGKLDNGDELVSPFGQDQFSKDFRNKSFEEIGAIRRASGMAGGLFGGGF